LSKITVITFHIFDLQ